ncbi:hypothetical protein TEA_003609 [Camellia sinensis var. sinensis]|uniref:Response regulatory domain-containing protein n=2 Tax=Camellia sinensis TaxID=4442 RepID=A0A4V3WMW5_CAMSN|nr:hypothetical protein TEA_003609 [Camellia sinensis var. sinensis]
MWEQGSSGTSSWTIEGPRGSSHTFAHVIHVLLVDHDKDSLASIARMLQLYSYKVTAVQSGLVAHSILLNGKEQFDLVLTDINLPDIDGFMLLQEAINKGLPTILMSANEDAMVAKIALENGACFFFERPIGGNMLKSLWQYVIKEKLFKVQNFEKIAILHDTTNQKGKLIESNENNPGEKIEIDSNSKKTMVGSKRKARTGKGINVDEVGELDKGKRKSTKKKYILVFYMFLICLLELECYPKEILDLMNVTGLTRMQVASHLQKCRNDNWRAPESRKANASGANSGNNSSQYKFGSRKFGTMPRLVKSSRNPQRSHPQQTRRNNAGLENYLSLSNSSLGNGEGEHTVQLIHSQPDMVPNYFGMQNMGQLGTCGNNVMCKGDYVNSASSDTGDETLATLLEMTSNQNPEPILSYFNNVTMEADYHSSSSTQNPIPDDFFDCLPDIRGPSKMNYSSIHELCTFDVEPIFFNQHNGRQA